MKRIIILFLFIVLCSSLVVMASIPLRGLMKWYTSHHNWPSLPSSPTPGMVVFFAYWVVLIGLSCSLFCKRLVEVFLVNLAIVLGMLAGAVVIALLISPRAVGWPALGKVLVWIVLGGNGVGAVAWRFFSHYHRVAKIFDF